MKNKIRIDIIMIILVVSTLAILVLYSNLSNKLNVYNLDINCNDLILGDFTVVTADNHCYIPKCYYIKRISDDQEIRDVAIEVSSKNKVLLDFVFQFDQLKVVEAPSDQLINDVKIRNNSSIIFKIKYKVDGVEKEFYQSVELDKHKKFE